VTRVAFDLSEQTRRESKLTCNEREHRPRKRNLESREKRPDRQGLVRSGSSFEGGEERDGREEEREEGGVDGIGTVSAEGDGG